MGVGERMMGAFGQVVDLGRRKRIGEPWKAQGQELRKAGRAAEARNTKQCRKGRGSMG